ALLGACDSAGVRVVAVAAGAAGSRNAAELGLYEVVDASAGWADLEELMTLGLGGRDARVRRDGRGRRDDPGPDEEYGGSEEHDRSEKHIGSDEHGWGEKRSRGEVIAVWGPAGAPGRTTIAIA